METWDAYDENRHFINHTLVRDNPIPKGLFHLVVEAIIQHEDGSILFMQRDVNKASYPSFFEATAGGSALKGEDSLTAVQRETLEETGISLKKKDCQLIHQFTNYDYACHFDIYLAKTNIDKKAIQLQKGETSNFIWVSIDQLKNFLNEHKVIPRQKNFLEQYLL